MRESAFIEIRAFAIQHGIPLSQLVEQATAAVLDGRIKLTPAVDYREARPIAEPVQLYVPERPAPQIYPGGTCACCVATIPTGTTAPIMVPWGRNDALVRICSGCRSGGMVASL
jgi:hypothetical protein